MLILLYYLAGWVEAWSASGNAAVSITFEMGPESRPKRSAWALFDGPSASGQVTVWDTGECQVEVVGTEAGAQILNEATTVRSVDELGSIVRRVLATCS